MRSCSEIMRHIANLPEEIRLEAFMAEGKDGVTFLYRVAPNLAINLEHNESMLDSIREVTACLELLPSMDRFALVNHSFRGCPSALHDAANNPETFYAILKLLPENDRLKAIVSAKREETCQNLSVLHLAIRYKQVDKIKDILLLLPPNERLEAIKQRTLMGFTPLHWCASRFPKAIPDILKTLPKESRKVALDQTSQDNTKVLQIIDDTQLLDDIDSLLREEVLTTSVTMPQR